MEKGKITFTQLNLLGANTVQKNVTYVRAQMWHLNASFVPSQGILTTNFAANCDVVIPRKGYFITFELFSSPQGREFDQKIQLPHLCPYFPHTPLRSKIDICIQDVQPAWQAFEMEGKGYLVQDLPSFVVRHPRFSRARNPLSLPF